MWANNFSVSSLAKQWSVTVLCLLVFAVTTGKISQNLVN